MTTPSNLAEKAGVKPALSQVPRGHWRNRWSDLSDGLLGPENPSLGDGTHLGFGKYVSAELAEQAAVEHLRKGRRPAHSYVGAIFFPANPENPSP